MGGVSHAALTSLPGSGASGSVTVSIAPGIVAGAGIATGLEPSLLSASSGGSHCTATNGCGVHVHSGTACTDKATQGGHYFNESVADPWASIVYKQTDAAGNANFAFMVPSSMTDVLNKPFIIHDNAGGRVSCGILTAPTMSMTTTTLTSMTTATITSMTTTRTTSMTTTITQGKQPWPLICGPPCRCVYWKRSARLRFDSQMKCQERAANKGHVYYTYNPNNRKCVTSNKCFRNTMTATPHSRWYVSSQEWRAFKNPNHRESNFRIATNEFISPDPDYTDGDADDETSDDFMELSGAHLSNQFSYFPVHFGMVCAMMAPVFL